MALYFLSWEAGLQIGEQIKLNVPLCMGNVPIPIDETLMELLILYSL